MVFYVRRGWFLHKGQFPRTGANALQYSSISVDATRWIPHYHQKLEGIQLVKYT
jgi:hypothetical protein